MLDIGNENVMAKTHNGDTVDNSHSKNSGAENSKDATTKPFEKDHRRLFKMVFPVLAGLALGCLTAMIGNSLGVMAAEVEAANATPGFSHAVDTLLGAPTAPPCTRAATNTYPLPSDARAALAVRASDSWDVTAWGSGTGLSTWIPDDNSTVLSCPDPETVTVTVIQNTSGGFDELTTANNTVWATLTETSTEVVTMIPGTTIDVPAETPSEPEESSSTSRHTATVWSTVFVTSTAEIPSSSTPTMVVITETVTESATDSVITQTLTEALTTDTTIIVSYFTTPSILTTTTTTTFTIANWTITTTTTVAETTLIVGTVPGSVASVGTGIHPGYKNASATYILPTTSSSGEHSGSHAPLDGASSSDANSLSRRGTGGNQTPRIGTGGGYCVVMALGCVLLMLAF